MSGGDSQAPKEKAHSHLLRRASSQKMALKEKIVQIYEAFFQGDDPSYGNPNFWDELFLLRVNTGFIENEIEKLNGESLLSLKDNFNLLFFRATDCLKQDHPIRVANALQTLCALVRGIFNKSLGNYGFDVINILIGFDSAETVMQTLIDSLNGFLTGDYVSGLKLLTLKLLLVFITAADNISQNTLLEYIMMNSVFEALIQILGHPTQRQVLGHDAALVLTLLVQYRKYESANPYVVKLSILDDELALTGYAQVVSTLLADFNREYERKSTEPQGGWFSTLANMMGNMFVAEEKQIELVRANDSILLALYEAIHLNRNFITALTHSHTPSTPTTPPSSPSPTSSPGANSESNVKDPPPLMAEAANTTQPTSLLVTFLQYSSIVIQDTKDLMVEFVMSHMMKTFPMELYLRGLGIVHRVLCYQKKLRVRIQYPWKELWTALINLLKFLLSHETQLAKKYNIFHLCSKIVNVFNLFITYGDTFLPNPNSYDELYYEIIRMHQTFGNLYSMALRYTTTDNEHKESAARLINHLVNIRAIINHFTPKVDSWAAANQLSSLTEEQVLEVVRGNYDTLTLKLQDSLDQFERYAEKPKEVPFFTNMVRSIICDVRKCNLSNMSAQHQELLQELSTIS
ncbi:hypothetical protein C0Q70_09253 [Pomacea canaliculata]|uniref:Armadillo-like helical domain-containing protein n=1 Tax=Pomacea canaliculata TaxID=400727 RepID=A0A2T7P996_POMCA|nr:hypothetical protein C0Q70_09253 [Pomacea canaliculata]